MGAKGNLNPLLDVRGNIVTNYEGKDELLSAFFASVFNSKKCCSPSNQSLELTGMGSRKKT